MHSNEHSKISKIQTVAENILLDIEVRVSNSNRKELSDEDLLILHSIFGGVALRALRIFEKHPTFDTYSTVDATRVLIEVKGENGRCYRVFPRRNYCSCLAFKHQVVVARSQFTCKHVLAARIASILGKTVDRTVTREQYLMLVNSMFETPL